MSPPKRKKVATLDATRVDRNVNKVHVRPRYVKWPPSFFAFLSHFKHEHGPLGRVARFAMRDSRCWPEGASSQDFIWRHMQMKHHGKGFDHFSLAETFRLYYEFVASKQKIPVRNTSPGDYHIIRYLSLSQETYAMLLQLCSPNKRAPGTVTERSPVIEEAIRFYHSHVLGKALPK